MDEELLIKLVEAHPPLYDPEDSHYYDDLRRTKIWEDIGNRLDETPLACKEKWKKIRENFRKAIALRKHKIGEGKKFKPPRYAKELKFIIPFIQQEDDETINDDKNETNDNISSPASTSSVPVYMNLTPTAKKPKTEELLMPESFHSFVTHDDDTIVDFFTNLGQTVRNFPADVRIRVKRAVFNIISEAEEEILRRSE